MLPTMLDCLYIIQRYYTPGNDDYRVLVLHSQQVAELAQKLAQRLITRQHQPVDVEFVCEAAMLHDIGMCRTDAPGIYCYGSEPYIMHGVLGRKMLDGMGLFRHGRVCERHTGAGITAQEIITQHLPISPARDLLPESIEEKLVCYADKFFSKSHPGEGPKPVERIRASMAKFGADSLQRFDEMVQLFGLPDDLEE